MQVPTFKEFIKKYHPTESYGSVEIKIKFANLVEDSHYYILKLNVPWSWFTTKIRDAHVLGELQTDGGRFRREVQIGIDEGRINATTQQYEIALIPPVRNINNNNSNQQ